MNNPAPKPKYHGGWANLSPEQRAERAKVATAKRLATMAQKRNRTQPRLPARREVIEVETISIPAPRHPHYPQQHQEGEPDLESLAQLIVEVWKKL
jgi:hypothetical protein